MRTPLLLGSSLVALTLSGSAYAGGIGLVATGGLHTARAYYYDQLGNQGIDMQARPNAGVGLMAMIGDRDDKVQGVFRIYMLDDAPTAKPTPSGNLTASDIVYPPADEQGWDAKGVGMVGVQWGLLGDPDKFQLTLESMIGTGFLTSNALEFLQVDVGPGVTYSLTKSVQAYGNVDATVRFRKIFSYGPNVYAGIRYMFD